MKLSVNWDETRARNAALEERATIAQLRAYLNGTNVCTHLRGNESVDHITLPLSSLAYGITLNWWKLFGGRDVEVPLIRHRDGYALPDLRLSYDGTSVIARSEQRIYDNPDVRFWAGPAEVLDRAEAEKNLGDFVSEVVTRLDQKGVNGTSVALRWERITETRGDASEQAFCEAAGALGIDPYQITDADTDWILTLAKYFADEPLIELLASSVGVIRPKLVDWLDAVERRPEVCSMVPGIASIADRISTSESQVQTKPWAAGYRRARLTRKALGLTSTDRFTSVAEIASRLGASKDFHTAPDVSGIRALRNNLNGVAHIHVRDQRNHPPTFSFARAVGDVICFPQPQRSTINELRSAYRQAAGRAFAAEFIAPIDEIRSMIEDGYDTVGIADQFNVPTEVIERQLENASRIDQTCKGLAA